MTTQAGRNDGGSASVESVRSIPQWLASIIQEFELNRPAFVTVDNLRHSMPKAPDTVRQAVRELVRRGWLKPLGARGTYEFIPGAAAGPYPSGDPWLVLRAELARHPGKLHIGANSAAWLRGYAQRSPSQHIVVAPSGAWVPRPVRSEYRVLATSPAPASDVVDGLPVPTAAELLAEVAQMAPRLNLDAAQGWLRRLLEDATPDDLVNVLTERGDRTRARAGYIAEVCGADGHADAIEALGPFRGGPFFTGPRRSGAPYSAKWQVYDSGKIA
jgi:hypothetical protein